MDKTSENSSFSSSETSPLITSSMIWSDSLNSSSSNSSKSTELALIGVNLEDEDFEAFFVVAFAFAFPFPFSPSPPSLFPYILLKCGFWELNLILVLARQIVYRMNYLHNSIINEFWVFVKPLLNADSVVVGKWKFSYWFLWSSIWILASSITLELWKLLLNGLHQTK